jgi:outer membrane receptor protein involved in Fe transport
LDKIDPGIIERMDVSKNGKESTIKITSKTSNGIPDGATVFVDGKKTSKKELDKIDSNLIESVNVLKGKNALEKYGEDGANGVIDIITKKR